MIDAIWYCNFGEIAQQNGQNCSVILPGLLTNPARFGLQSCQVYFTKDMLLHPERWSFG